LDSAQKVIMQRKINKCHSQKEKSVKRMEELEVAIEVVKKAGAIVKKYYGKVNASRKSDRSLTTKADMESENLIRNFLQKRFPDYSILGEETGRTGKESDYLWIVDPLDGTTNYAFQNPFFDISLGLVYKGKPIMGVVFYPPQNELFYAEKGKGAYLNDTRITVSDRRKFDDSIIAFCHGRDQQSVRRMINAFSCIKPINNKVRQLGAAALELCYVACGRIDAFFMVGINPWDVAAGATILKEAGGKVSDFSGKDFDLTCHDILGSNVRIHQRLLDILCGI
jgi:myo-inositol-1(or 4)-monophosphatase